LKPLKIEWLLFFISALLRRVKKGAKKFTLTPKAKKEKGAKNTSGFATPFLFYSSCFTFLGFILSIFSRQKRFK